MQQLIVNILSGAILVACMGCSFYIYYRPNKVFNLTHASTVLASAYCLIYFTEELHVNPAGAIGIAVGIGTIVGMMLTRTLDWVGGGKDRGVYVLVFSMGVALLIENVFSILFGAGVRRGSLGDEFDREVFWVTDSATMSGPQLAGAAGGVLALGAMLYIWYRTPLGRSARAIAENIELARLMGLPVARLLLLLSALSASGGATVGAFVGANSGVSPGSGLNYLMPGIIAAVIGGNKGLLGVVLGAVVIVSISSLSAYYIGSKWADMATYLLFASVLILRPMGIASSGGRAEEQ